MAIYGVKKLGGEAPYKALHQITTAVKAKLKEERNSDVLTIYLVVVVGTRISFWEMDIEAIDRRQPEQDVSSLWGCRSLLQSAAKYGGVYENKEPPYTTDKNNIPKGVKKLFIRRKVKKTILEEMRPIIMKHPPFSTLKILTI